MEQYKVELYIYDLSMGMARTLAPLIIGKPLDGIWHTSVVVYDREYLFNSNGVENCVPGTTQIGKPLKVELLGYTEVTRSVFEDYLTTLNESTFAAPTYNLFKHNCNNFTEEVAQFLVGKSIPKYILDLPNEVLNSSLSGPAQALLSEWEKAAHVQQHQQKQGSDFDNINNEIEEARYKSYLLDIKRKKLQEKLSKRERKAKKKRINSLDEGTSTMAETEVVNGVSGGVDEQLLALEEEERRELEEKKKIRDPPIVYKDEIDVKTEFDTLIGLIDGKISPDEQRSVEELSQYMLDDQGSWALSDGFLDFVGRILNDDTFTSEARIALLNILSVAALKDDVILLLHQDRKDHVLMNYGFQIDRLPIDEQKSLSLLFANMFENLSSSEWLLYISEWSFKGQQTSNIRVTTKIGVHCLLSDDVWLQDKGSAIIHNLGCKEKLFKNFRIRQLLPKGTLSKVFDDVAVELTMALLQYFNSKPSEEQLYRCMKALAKFVSVSRQEVPQLIQMIGPDPKSFRGASERVDQLIEQISKKLR